MASCPTKLTASPESEVAGDGLPYSVRTRVAGTMDHTVQCEQGDGVDYGQFFGSKHDRLRTKVHIRRFVETQSAKTKRMSKGEITDT